MADGTERSPRPRMRLTRRGRLTLLVLLLGLVLTLTSLLVPSAPARDVDGVRAAASRLPVTPARSPTRTRTVAPRPAAAGEPAAGTVSVPVAPRDVETLPGFRLDAGHKVLDVARFTVVGSLALPPSRDAGRVVLAAMLHVSVPTRTALSVRAWCAPAARQPSATSAAPQPSAASAGSGGPAVADRAERTVVAIDPGAAPDVLVIGQNPVPGVSVTEVASRTVTGRAVVDLSAHRPYACTLQLSPRTETLSGSRLHVASGEFSARPAGVPARAAQRSGVLVGDPGYPGSTSSAAPWRQVAVLAPVRLDHAGPLRAEGEVELTTCALGYHLCGQGTPQPAVVEAWLHASMGTAGRVCKQVDGRRTRIMITAAVHHVKVTMTPVAVPSGCGTQVSAWLNVRHLSGNAVEVEPALASGRVQTHLWVERAG